VIAVSFAFLTPSEDDHRVSKTPPSILLNDLMKKKKILKIWITTFRGNLTLESYKFIQFTNKLLPYYLEKCENVSVI